MYFFLENLKLNWTFTSTCLKQDFEIGAICDNWVGCFYENGWGGGWHLEFVTHL